MKNNKISKIEIENRYAIFNDAKTRLKNEFYGLDEIIDEIFKNIETWYIYPEYMTRPCIINLWGLTGVGKTDLVRKLRTYLQIEKFASTEMDNNSNSIEDVDNYSVRDIRGKSIFDILNQYEIGTEDKSILLLDEIHRYRTISPDKKNITRTRFNDIWKLLSDGCLFDSSFSINIINDNIYKIESKYDTIRMNLTSKEESFEDKINSIFGISSIDEEKIEKEQKEKDATVKKLGFVPFEMKKTFSNMEMNNFNTSGGNICDNNKLFYILDIDDEDMDKLKMLKFIYQGREDMMISEMFLRTAENNSGRDNALLKYFNGCSNKVMLEWLKYKKVKILESFNKLSDIELRNENTKFIYSKMLIFICGNIDKEDYVKNENKEENINIHEILTNLFRAEQISRFGNSYMIYPVLNKEEYDKIIYREIEFTETRLREEYETDRIVFNKEEIYKETIKELSEDYRYNGVRPVYSAIQRVLSNIIPKMLIDILV